MVFSNFIPPHDQVGLALGTIKAKLRKPPDAVSHPVCVVVCIIIVHGRDWKPLTFLVVQYVLCALEKRGE